MTHAYGKLTYWNERYTKESTSFDWYGRFGHFKADLSKYMNRRDNILHIGCGNSRFAEELYASEFTSIANIDYSPVVIKQMQERHAEKTTISWKVMDVTDKLDFPAGLFEVCIDKGCLDSILCGDSSTAMTGTALYNIVQALKPNGRFLMISHWGPEKWLGYLEYEGYNWSISVVAVPRPIVGLPPGEAQANQEEAPIDPSAVHYLYICEKNGDR